MAKYICFVLLCIFISCSHNYGQLTFITELPYKLEENSGLAIANKTAVWVIEDGGNLDEIYKVDFNGNIKRKFEVTNAKNEDWEDLAQDPKGNLYIGDFGNNSNDRKDLVIYKLNNPDKEKGKKIKAEKIQFKFPEQKKFPPKKSKLYYDTEAFFYHNDSLYLITKNRAKPYNGKSLIYRLPAKKGKYKAELISHFSIKHGNDDRVQITAADISPDGKTIAILGYGILWIIKDFSFPHFTKGKTKYYYLNSHSQVESVCFKDNKTLLISDEKGLFKGGNLYKFKID